MDQFKCILPMEPIQSNCIQIMITIFYGRTQKNKFKINRELHFLSQTLVASLLIHGFEFFQRLVLFLQ